MRLRIRTTDPEGSGALHGQGQFVRVEDAETGEQLGGVVAVRWELTEPFSVAKATITLLDVEMDAVLDPGELTLYKKALEQAEPLPAAAEGKD